MAGDVVVRMAGEDDVVALAGLRAAWVADADEPGFAERFAAWVAGEGDRRTTWVAEADHELVGLVSLFEYRRMPVPGRPPGSWGYLGNLFVLGPFRNRGIGQRLLTALLAEADRRGYVRVLLSPSARSVPLYRRAGFVDAGADAGPDRLLVRPARRT